MKQYKVKITDEALMDMEEVYSYIAEELLAPDAAMNQYNHIAEAILSLDVMPERIPIMPSEPEKSRKIRRMNIDNYAIFFIISADTVVVISVLYGASNITERLK